MHGSSVTSARHGICPSARGPGACVGAPAALAAALVGALGGGDGLAGELSQESSTGPVDPTALTAPARGQGIAAWPGAGWEPRLLALGASLHQRPSYPGSADSKGSLVPNLVLRWGRLTLSNDGPLASRSGEPTESGLSADVLSRGRLSMKLALQFNQGRTSSDVHGLEGLHNIPAHWRGRLQMAWRVDPQWEVITAWRADVSGRGSGSSLETIVLHDWRPGFMDQRRWRVSAGLAAVWLDSAQANMLHGVSLEDAARTRYSAYRLESGWSEVRALANWRRDWGRGWVAYGGVSAASLVRQAARSPIVQQPRFLSLSIGVGRRF